MSIESRQIASRLWHPQEEIPQGMRHWLESLVTQLAETLAGLPGALDREYSAFSDLFRRLPDVCQDPEVLAWLVKGADERVQGSLLETLANESREPIADILTFWDAAGRTDKADIDLVCAVTQAVADDFNHDSLDDPEENLERLLAATKQLMAIARGPKEDLRTFRRVLATFSPEELAASTPDEPDQTDQR